MKWQKLKDGHIIMKEGRYKVLDMSKRPHGGWCVFVFNKGEVITSNGYHATALPKKYLAIRWGISKATELGIIKGHIFKQFKTQNNSSL